MKISIRDQLNYFCAHNLTHQRQHDVYIRSHATDYSHRWQRYAGLRSSIGKAESAWESQIDRLGCGRSF